MKPTKYIRRTHEGYEYGLQCHETYKYHPIGVEKDYYNALAANNMASEGMPKIGKYIAPLPYQVESA